MPTRLRVALVAVLATLGLLVGVLAPSPASAGDSDRERKKQIDASIDKLKDDLDETAASLVKAAAALDGVAKKLAAAKAIVRSAQAEVAKAKAEEAALAGKQKSARAKELQAERDLVVVQQHMDATQGLINAIARAAYQRGRLSNIAVYLEAETPEDLTKRMSYTQTAVQSEDALLNQLGEEKTAVDARQAELETTRIELTDLRAQAQQTLDRRRASAATALAGQRSVAKLVATAQAAKAVLEREAAKERARIARAEAESLALQQKLLARSSNRYGGGFTGVSSSGFIRPSAGYISSGFGMRVHPITGVYKLHDGTDFAGGCGSPIRAAAAGRVLQRYYSGAWGNRVVLEHGIMRGKSVATAYNHMTQSIVSLGETVRQGQIIGYIGSTGYSTGCHLHFNVYVNGAVVNPMGWL